MAEHSAPPEVPEMPVMRCRAGSMLRNSACKTPPVKAVWLPPPWQAMAMVLGVWVGAVAFFLGLEFISGVPQKVGN